MLTAIRRLWAWFAYGPYAGELAERHAASEVEAARRAAIEEARKSVMAEIDAAVAEPTCRHRYAMAQFRAELEAIEKEIARAASRHKARKDLRRRYSLVQARMIAFAEGIG